MIANVILRLSCFSDYSVLSYNKDDVISILSTINELNLAPSLIQEVLPNGQVSQRMQFVSQNGLLVITIGTGRIDIQRSSDEKAGFASENLNSIGGDLNSLMLSILSIFSSRVSLPNRLAWFSTKMYYDISEEEKKEFRDKFIKRLSFFDENRLDDMTVRYGAKRIITIGDRQEKTNVLTTINQFSSVGNAIDIDGYQIDYDINTWQGNRINRFRDNDLFLFIENAIAIQQELDRVVFQ